MRRLGEALLGVAAIAAGWYGWGWAGVVLALTVIVFWMLLQFSRALRALRDAGAAPVGQVPSAVMLHAKLRAGMRLVDVLKLTRSLGERIADDPETFRWTDGGGDAVRVVLVQGRVGEWRLERAGP